MKMPNAKVWLIIAGLTALFGLGGWAYLREQNRVEYRTARVERGNIEATISATGNPNAVVTVQVGSQVSGNIKELYADFNTKVKKGQLVARIDPEIFDAKVNQAKGNLENVRAAVLNARAMIQKTEADIANARASLEAAKANAAKAKDQAAGYTIRATQAQHEVAVAQLASAEAQVKQNEAALKQAQVDLDHTYIRAPVDGTVVSRNVDVGQTVAASLQAPTLFLIAQDLTKMQVDTNVDEADIGRVHVGQDATFTVDAFPGESFKGKVVQIRQAAINIQNVLTYDAVIAVSNPDLKLFPGMTANVKILVDKREGVLKVPNAALRFRPPNLKEQPGRRGEGTIRTSASGPAGGDGSPGPRGGVKGGGQTIWVLGNDQTPQPVSVKLGITDGSTSDLLEGDLKEADEVIIGAVSREASGGPAQPFGQRGPRF